MRTKASPRDLLRLFLTFFKISAFTFGGGYAMISLIQREVVENHGWLDKDEFLDLIAIAESTPGPISINSATYIGYRVGGFLGAFLATFAVCLPSFAIIYVISLFLKEFLAITVINDAFRGIRVCVVFLILSAGIKMFKTLEKSLFTVLLFGLTLGMFLVSSCFSLGISSILFLLGGGAVGIIVYLIATLKNKKGGAEK